MTGRIGNGCMVLHRIIRVLPNHYRATITAQAHSFYPIYPSASLLSNELLIPPPALSAPGEFS
jgi:hypothetical protein